MLKLEDYFINQKYRNQVTSGHKHVTSMEWGLPFCALGFDWTSNTTVVTASAYMSFKGLASHW